MSQIQIQGDDEFFIAFKVNIHNRNGTYLRKSEFHYGIKKVLRWMLKLKSIDLCSKAITRLIGQWLFAYR